MPEAPDWACRLVATVCAEAGRPIPRLTWRRRSRPTSSGVTRQADGVVAVMAGTDVADQRHTLLHELAHWISPRPRRGRRRLAHHDRGFYEIAFALYQCHCVLLSEALAGEAARYPSSLRHARELGVPGAEAAWRERRAILRERARDARPWRVLVEEHVVRLVRDGRWTRCATCRARVVGPTLRRLRRRSGRHVLMARG
jgi:hypothetical protein